MQLWNITRHNFPLAQLKQASQRSEPACYDGHLPSINMMENLFGKNIYNKPLLEQLHHTQVTASNCTRTHCTAKLTAQNHHWNLSL